MSSNSRWVYTSILMVILFMVNCCGRQGVNAVPVLVTEPASVWGERTVASSLPTEVLSSATTRIVVTAHSLELVDDKVVAGFLFIAPVHLEDAGAYMVGSRIRDGDFDESVHIIMDEAESLQFKRGRSPRLMGRSGLPSGPRSEPYNELVADGIHARIVWIPVDVTPSPGAYCLKIANTPSTADSGQGPLFVESTARARIAR